MPNTLAYIVLLVWPLVTFAIFSFTRPAQAVVWSLLAAYLLLPVKTAFDFPGVPALDKTSISNISTYVAACVYTNGNSLRLPREWWIKSVFIVYLISPIFTTLSNQDAFLFGQLILPSLSAYDAVSATAYKAINLLPFLLGYNFLRTTNTQREFLVALVGGALAYSALMLVEIRLSPQLHTWIYGFFPHSFAQQMRGEGFRPVVFLGHGLLVAIFTAMATTGAVYLACTRRKVFGISSWIWFVYLLIILILCKSLGSLTLAVFASALVLALSSKSIQIICGLTAIFVLSYPALRGADMVPVQAVANYVEQYSSERAASLQTRIDNEDRLLARANQRPMFGWGGYGRNRVYDEKTGADLSITDGTWIIVAGTEGWIGYFALFGSLCLPILMTTIQRHAANSTAIIVNFILAINLLDLLPNSSIGPLTWLMAGAAVPLTITRVRSQLTSVKRRFPTENSLDVPNRL